MPNTNYPGAIDTNPGDPTASETLGAGNHAFLHGFAQDAIVALETYVGAAGSAVTSSLTYIISHIIPTLSAGAILYGNASSVLTALAAGASGQVLTLASGLPSWQTPNGFPTGATIPFAGAAAPSGWLMATGVSFSTLTAPALAIVLAARFGFGSTVPATYAASVLTAVAHGLANGQIAYFSGTLPSGLSLNTPYYVIGQTANTFQVSLTSGGSAVSITGTGSLSFSSSLLTPNVGSRGIIGAGTGSVTAAITANASNVLTLSGLTNSVNNEFRTGQSVTFNATTAGNLTNGAAYFVISITPLTISVATSLANAQNTTPITLAGTEAGSFTLTFSTRTLGDTLGEENHAMSLNELLSHHHSNVPSSYTGNQASGNSEPNGGSSGITSNAGGNAAMSIINPSIVMPYIIKT